MGGGFDNAHNKKPGIPFMSVSSWNSPELQSFLVENCNAIFQYKSVRRGNQSNPFALRKPSPPNWRIWRIIHCWR